MCVICAGRHSKLSCLVPFLQQTYPDGHRFVQDNDPKHSSCRVQGFFSERNINWWKVPPECPDAENLCHELKEFVRREVKPKTKDEWT